MAATLPLRPDRRSSSGSSFSRTASGTVQRLQHFVVQDAVGGDEALRGEAPRFAGEVCGASSGFGDEQDCGGVIPGRVAGADGDVEVAGREPGAADARAAEGSQLTGIVENLVCARVLQLPATQRKVRAGNSVLQSLRIADPQGKLFAACLPESSAPGACVVKVSDAGCGDGGVGYDALFHYRDTGAEHRVRLHEVGGPVHGVKEPGPSP